MNQRKCPKRNSTHTKTINGTKLLIQTKILQTDGLAMGAPTSATLAEAYIQNMEHNKYTQY
jgi:hypothetical protein